MKRRYLYLALALLTLVAAVGAACDGSESPETGAGTTPTGEDPNATAAEGTVPATATSAPLPTLGSTSAETDRETLVALYNATNGENWDDNANWLSDAPIGEWRLVTTDDDGRVTKLDLFSNQLSGEIPRELARLSNLEVLGLGRNQLSGEIPPELGRLSNLEVLSLSENLLSGEIPPELGNLANLKMLLISYNQLSGKIPPELGRLSNLIWLLLVSSQLSGEIPPELGNLANLNWLSLYENQLSGEIPPELARLANLNWLSLNENQLSGCVPSALQDQLYMNSSDLGGLPFC